MRVAKQWSSRSNLHLIALLSRGIVFFMDTMCALTIDNPQWKRYLGTFINRIRDSIILSAICCLEGQSCKHA